MLYFWYMLIEIKKPATPRKLAAAERKLAAARKKKKAKGFDAHRFCGTIKWEGDAVEIQRQMRNEWL